MSRAIPDPAELNAALNELKQRKPYRIAAYAQLHGIPAEAGERFAVALLTAHTRKPGPAAKKLAAACDYFKERRPIDGDRKAHQDTCERYGIKRPTILDNALRGCRSDVNAIREKTEN